MRFALDAKLIELCKQLVDLAEHPQGDGQQLADTLNKFLEAGEFKINVIAAWLGVSDQTIYRWLRKEATPKPTYMKRLRLLVEEQLEQQPQKPVRTVRIGVPPFWDAALIVAFESSFASHGIKPQFVSTSAIYKGIHQAFQENLIDIAISSHFLARYDQQLRERNDARFQSLAMRYPLFSFNGYYIYVSRTAVEKALSSTAEMQSSSHVRVALEALLQGRWFGVAEEDRKSALQLLLPRTHSGAERGTGFELAFRSAYHKHDLDFERNTHLNLRNDYPFAVAINGLGNNADLAETREAFEAFLEGTVDLFCGGLAHHYYLQHYPYSATRRATDSKSGSDFLVLFRPGDVDVRSYAGIVAPEGYDAEIVETVAKIWQAGAAQFLRWTSEANDTNEDATALAAIQLAAMLRLTERYSPPELRIMSQKYNSLLEWQQWITNSSKHWPHEGEVRQHINKLAEKSVEFYRQDWIRRVREWAFLLTSHCQMFTDLTEARRAYALRYNEYGEQHGRFLIGELEKMTAILADSDAKKMSEDSWQRENSERALVSK